MRLYCHSLHFGVTIGDIQWLYNNIEGELDKR